MFKATPEATGWIRIQRWVMLALTLRNMCPHIYLLYIHTHLHVFLSFLFLSVFMSVCCFNYFILSSLSPSVIITVFVCVCVCVLCRQMFECMFFFQCPPLMNKCVCVLGVCVCLLCAWVCSLPAIFRGCAYNSSCVCE